MVDVDNILFHKDIEKYIKKSIDNMIHYQQRKIEIKVDKENILYKYY